MVGRQIEVVVEAPEPRVFVMMLTEPEGADRAAVALTVRSPGASRRDAGAVIGDCGARGIPGTPGH